MGQLDNISLGDLARLIQKNATGTPNVTEVYGDGGLFGICSAEGSLVNAMVGPTGIEKVLRWYGSKLDNPIYEAFTYIGSTSYDQSSGCASCGRPEFAVCRQTSCFGRICQATGEMQADQIGLFANDGIRPRVLYGNITDPAGRVIVPAGQTIQDVHQMQVFGMGHNLRNRVHYEMWNGTGATVGGHTQMTPFPTLINTGHIDALDATAAACTALDSTLMNYGTVVVGSVGAPNIVNYFNGMMARLWNRMDSAGFDSRASTTYAVMSHHLADCFWNAYACAYGQVCNTAQVTSNDALAVAGNAEKWAAASAVPAAGRMIPVVFDNQVPYTRRAFGNTPSICSDIYFITTEVAGAPNGGAVTYGEYQDFSVTAADAVAFMQANFGGNAFSVTDGGRYLLAFTNSGGFCFDYKLLVKPRIVIREPQWCGRIQNVCCAPTGGVPFKDPTGGDGIYTVGGGIYSTPVTSLYGPCAQQTGSYGQGAVR